MASVGSISVNLFARTAGFRKDLGKAQSAISKTSQQISGMGKSLTTLVTAPLAAAGVASIATSLKFGESMNKIVSLVGVARAEVDKMKPAVVAMASAFGKSASEAAEAMFFIQSAGLRGAEAIDVLRTSLKASAVGLGQTQVIADLLTSSVNAYGSDVLSAAEAGDILTSAVREGKLEATELAGSIGRVLPVASAMGVKMNEVAAAMAAMSRTGTNAEEGATQLRSIMTSILKPTKEAEDQLKALGLSSSKLRSVMREEGLLATLELLTEKFGDSEEAIGNVFGNVRALVGVMDLMGANADGTRQIFDALGRSAGALNTAFKETESDAMFRIKKAFAGLQNQMIAFGDTLVPLVEKITAWLEKIIEKLKSMSAEDRELAVTVGLIAAAIGPALIAVGFMLKAVAGVIVVIKAAVLVFSALTAGIGGLVVGLAALGAASYLIGKHWLGLGQIGEWLGQKIWDAWEAIPGLVGSATASLADFGVAFKDQALSWYNYFVGLFEKAFSWFGDKISWVTDKFNAVKGWMPGGGGKVDGERARGGRVNTGGSYLVGERGPEIFAPDMSGRIIPNNDIEGGGASAKTLSNIETLLLEMREALI